MKINLKVSHNFFWLNVVNISVCWFFGSNRDGIEDVEDKPGKTNGRQNSRGVAILNLEPEKTDKIPQFTYLGPLLIEYIMKHQQVSVDYWTMLKSMVMYGVLTVLGWMMLRLFNAVFSLPRRLRTQQENIQATLEEFQRRYPDLNVTEDDIKNADKELEEWSKEMDEKLNKDETKEDEAKEESRENEATTETCQTPPAIEEDKKTI